MSFSNVYANKIGLGSGLKQGIKFWVRSEIARVGKITYFGLK